MVKADLLASCLTNFSGTSLADHYTGSFLRFSFLLWNVYEVSTHQCLCGFELNPREGKNSVCRLQLWKRLRRHRRWEAIGRIQGFAFCEKSSVF